MKNQLHFGVLLVVILLCFVACGKEQEPTIELKSAHQGETIDLCAPAIREYLDADTESEQIEALQNGTNQNCVRQNVAFQWESDGSIAYTLYVADNKEFKDAYQFETVATLVTEAGILLPGTTYYWKVVGSKEGSASQVGTFKTLDAPVRCITTTDIPNVRDIGGWKTEQGQTVRYGLIYRGGKTNKEGRNTCTGSDALLFSQRLGINTEIDLRTPNADDGNQTSSVFGDEVFYDKTTLTQYSFIFPEFKQTEPYKRSYDSRSKYSIQEIFRVLSDEEKYPIYFHCNAGADRTGTVAFLINGVLGVSYEDLTRDFEITSFANVGGRYRSNIVNGAFTSEGVMQDNTDNYIAWDKMYRTMMETYGTQDGSLASAIENYLVTVCEVKKEDIEKLKSFMLE